MTKEEQIQKCAREAAIDDLTTQEISPTHAEKIEAVVNDYFNGIGITDQETIEQVSKRLIDSTGITRL